MTGHRSQGRTLRGRTIIHIHNSFCPGLAYVMISRVTNREQLRIFGKLTPQDFVPINEAAFLPRDMTNQDDDDDA
jgi:hypothetical protein